MKVRLTSPRSSTSVPLTVPALGKLTTMPPGQWASVPARSVQPQTPTVAAPVMSTSRSVPAAEVTVMRLRARSILAAARTRVSSSGVRPHALERLRVLVGDHQDAGAGLQDRRRLRRVHQAFERAVDHEARLPERGDDRREAADRLAGAGRAHRHRMAVARGRHHEMERPRAEPQQRELRQLHVERARLGLRQDGGGVAALDRAALEDLAEGVDPLAFDPVGQHLRTPRESRSARARATR